MLKSLGRTVFNNRTDIEPKRGTCERWLRLTNKELNYSCYIKYDRYIYLILLDSRITSAEMLINSS